MYPKNPMAWYKGKGENHADSFENMLSKIERWGYIVQGVFRKDEELCVKIKGMGTYKTHFGFEGKYCQLKLYK